MGRGYEPVPDPVAVRRTCERRALEREGIPMFLGLEDRRGPETPVTDARARTEGPRLARLTRTYGRALGGGGPEQAAAALQVTAYAHFTDHADDEGAR